MQGRIGKNCLQFLNLVVLIYSVFFPKPLLGMLQCPCNRQSLSQKPFLPTLHSVTIRCIRRANACKGVTICRFETLGNGKSLVFSIQVDTSRELSVACGDQFCYLSQIPIHPFFLVNSHTQFQAFLFIFSIVFVFHALTLIYHLTPPFVLIVTLLEAMCRNAIKSLL